MHLQNSLKNLRGATILLDVDGTLVADKGEHLTDESVQALRALSEHNTVYLVSNGDSKRTARIAESAGVESLPRTRKPYPHKAIRALKSERTVVVGDKFLTDGLLALFIGAEFIRVPRLTHVRDSVPTQMIYALDDAAYLASPYIALARPRQWVKNFLVFAPAFFAGTVLAPEVFGAAFLAFIAFCFSASAVYIFNDIIDLEEDKKHPKKRFRPLPSGHASPVASVILGAVLAAFSLALSAVLPNMILITAGYLALNAGYSLLFRKVPVVDVTVVASFYVLRVVAGGAATAVLLSPWILLATFFLALFLVTGKRKGEHHRAERRKALDGYAPQALDALLVGSAVLALASYGLWSVLVHPESGAVYSVIPVTAVLFLVMNKIYLEPEKGEAPEAMVFTDRWVLGLTALWAVSMFFMFYS